MAVQITLHDTIGLAKTEVDAHTLGLAAIDEILQECGFNTIIAEDVISKAFSEPRKAGNSSLIEKWIRQNKIGVLGFSYRLNVDDAVLLFQMLMYQLDDRKLLEDAGGPVKKVCFAGLPAACDKIRHLYDGRVCVFCGDENPLECLEILGIDSSLAPGHVIARHPYDLALEDFGRNLIQKADYESVKPVDRHASKNYGSRREKLIDRIKHGKENKLPPIIRAHVGPYEQNRTEAVKRFVGWAHQLAQGGLLDVLSIGTSQLTQERFGQDWDGLPNGGGVPINSPQEYRTIYNTSRPILVRTYAGTKNIKKLAGMHEETINIAWHALSLWWFSQIDGRGPNSVLDNLKEHFDTISYIASVNKPYEPNVSHHFAFRSSDDISYVVSSVLAARAAKKMGIKDFILQVMLNVPKYTWGVNDLAKARATLRLVRQLEDADFHVYLQTRAGLDYLSHEPEKAKAQLASVTALMDDIEPHNTNSPEIIHVVSYSEGSCLATPQVVEESIKITRRALDSYRLLKNKGDVDDMARNPDVNTRMDYLVEAAAEVLTTIDECIENPYTPEGFYDIFKMGFLPVPQLMYCREEFPEAVKWQTKTRNGCVDIYDNGKILSPQERMQYIRKEIIHR